VPAIIVGIVVYVLAGSGGSSVGGAGVIDGFIRLGSSGDEISSFEGKLPPNFPNEFPSYKGAKLVTSFAVESDQGTSYFVVYSTKDSTEKVYDFYLETLEEDPWQVELARSSTEFTGVQFSRPDDADVQGDVTIHHSDLDGTTAIFVSFQDLTPSGRAGPIIREFVPMVSKPLPPGFPSDIPIYESRRDATIVSDTYLERGPGGVSYIVTFLTKDSGDDVIGFYKGEFQKRGWVVTDSQLSSSLSNVGIDFRDGPSEQLQGTIQADAFDEDPAYTKVDLLLQVSSSRSRGGN
jgi:hypothetical protein